MQKVLKVLGVLAVAMGGFTAAHAADSSATVVLRDTLDPVGQSSLIGYVEVTATAAAASANAMTFDLPVATTTADIRSFVAAATDSSGIAKPLAITRSGITVTVADSNAASGTIASGDVVKALVIYQP